MPLWLASSSECWQSQRNSLIYPFWTPGHLHLSRPAGPADRDSRCPCVGGSRCTALVDPAVSKVGSIRAGEPSPVSSHGALCPALGNSPLWRATRAVRVESSRCFSPWSRRSADRRGPPLRGALLCAFSVTRHSASRVRIGKQSKAPRRTAPAGPKATGRNRRSGAATSYRCTGHDASDRGRAHQARTPQMRTSRPGLNGAAVQSRARWFAGSGTATRAVSDTQTVKPQ